VNPYVFAAAGARQSRNVTNDVHRNVALVSATVPLAHLGFGAALNLGKVLPFWKGVDWGLEFSGNLRLPLFISDPNQESPDAYFSYGFFAREEG
jgi:hypothetical protein